MHDLEKSDSAVVAVKSPNKAGSPAAEAAEPRAGTKGNADQQSTHRTQTRARVTQALNRVRQAARQRKKERFTALLHHVNVDTLWTAFYARQLIVQEAGIIALIERKVRVLTASGDDLTETDDPFKVAMRQIAGVFAQLEKARLVGKLKAARDRKRAAGVKVEGRKSYAEIDARDHNGLMLALARKLRRQSPKGGQALTSTGRLGVGESGLRQPYGQTVYPDGDRPNVG
jgi:hypothetical protein